MTKRNFFSTLLAAALICGACGCSKGDDALRSVPESISLTPLDFDEAVKSIQLFGHEFSLPCNAKDFGEGFSLEEMSDATVDGIMTYSLLYKGKKVGYAFTDVKSQEPSSVTLKAVSIGLISMDLIIRLTDEGRERMLEMFDPVEFEAAGLSFNSTLFDAEKVLGAPLKNEGNSVFFDVEHNGGYFKMEFYRGKVCGMEISLIGGTENEH